ncbi:DNA polymerase III subunit beta [compost metagenome]
MNKQAILAKYAKKFATKQNGSRPILEGIHYATDGTAYVTDGHILLKVRNVHTLSDPTTVSVHSGMPIEGVYPSVTKIIPMKFDHEIQLGAGSLKDVLTRATCAADTAKRLDKSDPLVRLVADNGSVHFVVHDQDRKTEFRAFFGNTLKVFAAKWALNAEFLRLALSLFADAGRDLTVKLSGSMSPIVLTDNEDIEILILPYRVAN